MFSVVNIGERAVSGIPLIMKASKDNEKTKNKLIFILNSLYHENIERNNVSTLLNCSKRTANTYINYLIGLHILEKTSIKGKYNFIK